MLREVASLEIKVRAKQSVPNEEVFTKVYFYEDARLLHAINKPTAAYLNTNKAYPPPTVFGQGEVHPLFFPLPASLTGRRWSAVVVVGTSEGAVARVFPEGASATTFDFPERDLVMRSGRVESTQAGLGNTDRGRVIEFIARTRSVKQPQITLLFRMPPGVTKMSELRGLWASVRLGYSIEDVREAFLRETAEVKPGSVMELAQRYKLGVLCWGARTLWTRGRDAEELTPAQRKAEDAEFDLVAEGWERGLDAMAAQYGIPRTNLVIDGISQAAQWSHRLVLRKPERFLAIHAHVSSSYDVPTAKAASVSWLVTTGEQEAGCENAMAFYERCRALGYPMIFKAEPGLGHDWSRNAEELKVRFFDWVLANAAAVNFDRRATQARLLAGFRSPAFLGDYGTHEMVPVRDRASLDAEVPVPLPTAEIARIWAGEGAR